jgi:hypothetical protein
VWIEERILLVHLGEVRDNKKHLSLKEKRVEGKSKNVNDAG